MVHKTMAATIRGLQGNWFHWWKPPFIGSPGQLKCEWINHFCRSAVEKCQHGQSSINSSWFLSLKHLNGILNTKCHEHRDMKSEWIKITSIDWMDTYLYKFDTPTPSASFHPMDIEATALLTILILSANATPKELGGQMKSLQGRNIRIIGAM